MVFRDLALCFPLALKKKNTATKFICSYSLAKTSYLIMLHLVALALINKYFCNDDELILPYF